MGAHGAFNLVSASLHLCLLVLKGGGEDRVIPVDPIIWSFVEALVIDGNDSAGLAVEIGARPGAALVSDRDTSGRTSGEEGNVLLCRRQRSHSQCYSSHLLYPLPLLSITVPPH